MKRLFTFIICLTMLSMSAFSQNALKIEGMTTLEDGTIMLRTNFSVLNMDVLMGGEEDYSLGAYVSGDSIQYFVLISESRNINVPKSGSLLIRLADGQTLKLPVSHEMNWEKDHEVARALSSEISFLRIPFLVSEEELDLLESVGAEKMRIECQPANIDFKCKPEKVKQSTKKWRNRLAEMIAGLGTEEEF